MALAIDHLVVAAPDLESGAAHVARTLGVAPAAGGARPDRAPAAQRQVFQEHRPRVADRPAAQQKSAPRWLHDYNPLFASNASRFKCPALPIAPMIS
ncbi:VOC family protein [Achromobacter sp. DMS1]|uniref:VOC family protein n=1 Tax=Achromobacter sp. DMS1 TaxID=1688405 RepID=UPI00128F6A5F